MAVLNRARLPFASGFAVCLALLATALYFQHVKGLEPCPLCIFQRVTVAALAVVLLVAAIHGPGALGRRVYGALVVVLGAIGLAIAGRQVWLQSLPPDLVPECGPGLEYMLQAFPLTEALSMVLRGSGECAEVQWVFLGLTIPGWNMVVFSGFILLGLWALLARAPRAAA